MKKAFSPHEAAWIWGAHSVEAALECYPELILELLVEKGGAEAQKIETLAAELGVKVQRTSLPRFLEDRRSQGLAARMRYFPTVMWKNHLETLSAQISEEASQWVLLDEVQDPRNFGAILRSAAAFGVKGVFIAAKNQAPITGVVAQTSAGTVFRLPIVVCNNLKTPLEYFREKKVPSIALEMSGQSVDSYLSLKKPSHLLWVLGSEGEGLQPRLREVCTESLGIPMENGVESLNVSAAATVIFYIAKQHLSNCL